MVEIEADRLELAGIILVELLGVQMPLRVRRKWVLLNLAYLRPNSPALWRAT
jgi:hypothetical protein